MLNTISAAIPNKHITQIYYIAGYPLRKLVTSSLYQGIKQGLNKQIPAKCTPIYCTSPISFCSHNDES